MSKTDTDGDRVAGVHEEYVLGVKVVELAGEDPRYRFEAPDHAGVEFDDPEAATLYADVYFDVNGFVEAGTGDRGVPPEVVQAGKDTLAAYLVSRTGADVNWVASFFGRKPGQIEEYLSWVRTRAAEIRAGARERDIAT